MIITCPKCATRYSLDETNIPDGGRQVRCAQCAHAWHQDRPEPNDLLSLDQDTQSDASGSVPQLENEPGPESDAKDETKDEAEDEAKDASDAKDDAEDEARDEEGAKDEAKEENEDDSFEIEVIDLEEAEETEESGETAETEPSDETEPADAMETSDEQLDIDADESKEPDESENPEKLGEDTDADGKDGADVQEARIAEWRATRARTRASAAEMAAEPPHSDKRGWIILVVVVAIVIGGIAGFREQISSAWPPSQRLYDVFGSWFATDEPEAQEVEEPEPEEEPKEIAIDVTSSRIAVIDGQRVLIIEGMITNPGQSELPVPAMHGALLDAEGEALHEWDFSIPFATIEAGTQREFEVRVVDPPSGARVMKLDPLINN